MESCRFVQLRFQAADECVEGGGGIGFLGPQAITDVLLEERVVGCGHEQFHQGLLHGREMHGVAVDGEAVMGFIVA